MKKIYLVDGNNFIYRMFFALPEFSTKDGKIVNAIFGMAKFFVGQLINENPDYLVFVKDAKGENFRHELYSEYKATRERMPDNLRSQIIDIEKMIELMGVNIVEIPGYEADDVIGALATKFSGNKDYEIDILTGDKDLYSLVSENVKIYDTMKKKKFGPEETRQKFEIEPKMIIDYLAIVGDKADNIPGIEGFGPKKAVALINGIGSVEKIYEVLDSENYDTLPDEVKKLFKGKALEKLIANREKAFLSKKLATIANNMDLGDFDIDNFKFHSEEIMNEKILEFFKELEFYSLLGDHEVKQNQTWKDLGLSVQIVDNDEKLSQLFEKIKKYDEIVLDTETTSLDFKKAELVGVSIYLDNENIFYINRLHKAGRVSEQSLHHFLDKLFESDKTIVGHNLKYDLQILDLYRAKTVNEILRNNDLGDSHGQMTFEI